MHVISTLPRLSHSSSSILSPLSFNLVRNLFCYHFPKQNTHMQSTLTGKKGKNQKGAGREVDTYIAINK